MTGTQRRVFLLTTALFWASMYTYPVLLGNYTTGALGGTAAMAGLVVGSYGFTQMVLRIPVGYASDRLRTRKPFLLAGIAASLLAALGLFVAGSPAIALVSRGMAGVSASTWVCFTVLFAGGLGGTARNRAMGTLSAWMYGAQLVATLLGSALAQAAGVRFSFLLAAGAAALGLLLGMRVADAPPQGAPVSPASIALVLRNRLLLGTSAISILMQMVLWSTLYGFSPAWAEQALGAQSAQLGLLSAVHLVPTILFSRLGASYLAPRIGERRTVQLGFACLAASCLLLPFTTAYWQMLCLQAVCGMGIGCAAPMLLSLSGREIAPAHQGIAMGAYQSIYGIGMFLGPMLAGGLVQLVAPTDGSVPVTRGHQAVFVLAGLLALLAAVLAFRLPDSARKKEITK